MGGARWNKHKKRKWEAAKEIALQAQKQPLERMVQAKILYREDDDDMLVSIRIAALGKVSQYYIPLNLVRAPQANQGIQAAQAVPAIEAPPEMEPTPNLPKIHRSAGR